MQYPKAVETYISQLSEERQVALYKMYDTLSAHLPKGFEAGIQYKNFIGLYHMGIYAKKELLDWFVSEYPKHCKYKLDMGKSCVRFKRIDDIPYELIAALAQKMTADDWIEVYENAFKKK